MSQNTSSVQGKSNKLSQPRRLATVRRIAAVPDFSRDLDLLMFDGWKVLAKKQFNFTDGELVIFIQVDAFLPADSPFADTFSQVGSPLTEFQGTKGYRVGTQIVHNKERRRIFSQGHVFKLSAFPPAKHAVETWQAKGQDISQMDFTTNLRIRKWVQNDGDLAVSDTRPFPTFLIKTDISRLEDCPNLFKKDKYKRLIYQKSIKMDGASMTCYFVTANSKYFKLIGPASDPQHVNGHFGVCSKNKELNRAANNIYWDMALSSNIDVKLQELGRSIAIQGELVGDGINGNPYAYPAGKHEFFVYSAIDIEKQMRIRPREVEALAKKLALKHVQVLGYETVRSKASCHQDLLDQADASQGEGLVFKCIADGRWFKALSRKWITEKGDEAQAQKAERAQKPMPPVVAAEKATARKADTGRKPRAQVKKEATSPKTEVPSTSTENTEPNVASQQPEERTQEVKELASADEIVPAPGVTTAEDTGSGVVPENDQEQPREPERNDTAQEPASFWNTPARADDTQTNATVESLTTQEPVSFWTTAERAHQEQPREPERNDAAQERASFWTTAGRADDTHANSAVPDERTDTAQEPVSFWDTPARAENTQANAAVESPEAQPRPEEKSTGPTAEELEDLIMTASMIERPVVTVRNEDGDLEHLTALVPMRIPPITRDFIAENQTEYTLKWLLHTREPGPTWHALAERYRDATTHLNRAWHMTQIEAHVITGGQYTTERTLQSFPGDRLPTLRMEWWCRSQARTLRVDDWRFGTNAHRWAKQYWPDREINDVNDIYDMVQAIKFSEGDEFPIYEVWHRENGLKLLMRSDYATPAERVRLREIRDEVMGEYDRLPSYQTLRGRATGCGVFFPWRYYTEDGLRHASFTLRGFFI